MLRRKKIEDRRGIVGFLDANAAFLVQKCIFEYARARSGVFSSKLFKEAAFASALESSRWRNYPLALRHVSMAIEHALRKPAGADALAMREGLVGAVAEICQRYPLPEGFEQDFWSGAQDMIAQRIRRAGLAPPHAIKDLPKETAREFFEHLPMHAQVRANDFELITNNQRVNLCRIHEDFLAAADGEALTAALVRAGAAAAR
jgi:hypothetical protein